MLVKHKKPFKNGEMVKVAFLEAEYSLSGDFKNKCEIVSAFEANADMISHVDSKKETRTIMLLKGERRGGGIFRALKEFRGLNQPACL